MFSNASCKIHHLIILCLSISLTNCSSYQKNSTNKKYTLSKEDLINAQFYFYKNTDTSLTLYTIFNTSPLLYARLDTGMQFYGNVKISVYLYSNNQSDSTSKVFYIPQTLSYFFSQIPIVSLSIPNSAKIIITDNHKKIQYTYFTELKLNNENARNNFLITIHDSILFKPYAYEGSTLKIYHRKKTPQLYVDVFHQHPNAAPPPFANIVTTLNYLPDSSFTIPITNNQYYLLNILPRRYYHIRTSQNTIDGLTLFSIDSIFPNIKDISTMLYSARYIMNKNEFERCLNQPNTNELKKCIDNFWIQIAGSKERAKQVIKNYYQRVIEANQLFTSYKYGWQTDRGMIYIIFGPPENIQKSYQQERWYYSINGQKNALMFTFTKNKNNPFTSSDFILERTDYYKDIWYIQVDKIRQGRLTINK